MKGNFESTSSITTAYRSTHEDIPTSDIKEIKKTTKHKEMSAIQTDFLFH